MSKKKLLSKEFWKNYNISFYAGVAGGLAVVLWQTIDISNFYLKTLFLVISFIIIYFKGLTFTI